LKPRRAAGGPNQGRCDAWLGVGGEIENVHEALAPPDSGVEGPLLDDMDDLTLAQEPTVTRLPTRTAANGGSKQRKRPVQSQERKRTGARGGKQIGAKAAVAKAKAEAKPEPKLVKKDEPDPDDATITLLASSNPKKPGSKSYERFKHYRDGMTVRSFLSAGGSGLGSAARLHQHRPAEAERFVRWQPREARRQAHQPQVVRGNRAGQGSRPGLPQR
jgi:hypothetical protein